MGGSSESQQSRVVVQLRDLILKGEFSPGERLAEIPLAERLGVSRTPVRLALATLEHEGLVMQSSSGGYQMRRFTVQEVADAIRIRGVIEGYAARLLAEKGVSPELSRQLHACLAEGDRAVNKPTMELDDYTLYVEMNDRFHDLLISACDNFVLSRVISLLNSLPFASASAMLPMQSSMEEGHQWMKHAHRIHHAILQAMERGQGLRAQALGEEHVEIASMNLDYAMDKPDLAVKFMQGMRLVSEMTDHHAKKDTYPVE